MQGRDTVPGAKALLRHRTHYRDLELAPIPLRPEGKQPTSRGWQDPGPGIWEETAPNANLGIVCGAPSNGLLVLDIDRPEVSDRIFEETPQELAEKTIVVETRRGFHVYARSTEPLASGQLPGDAGDIKGQGGLVVAPPSVHPTGVRYTFVRTPDGICPLSDLDLAADLGLKAATQPDGRVDAPRKASPRLVRRVEAFVRSQSHRFQRRVQALRQGTETDRSGAEFMLATGMAEAGFSDQQIASILLTWGQKAPQRDLRYLQRTIARGREAAQRSRVGSGGGEN